MKETIEKAEKLSWPPTVEELEKREPTKELLDFLRHLLVGGDSHHGIGERKLRVFSRRHYVSDIKWTKYHFKALLTRFRNS